MKNFIYFSRFSPKLNTCSICGVKGISKICSIHLTWSYLIIRFFLYVSWNSTSNTCVTNMSWSPWYMQVILDTFYCIFCWISRWIETNHVVYCNNSKVWFINNLDVVVRPLRLLLFGICVCRKRIYLIEFYRLKMRSSM